MQRKEKQIKDTAVIEHILKSNCICRTAFSCGNMPYIIPMNYGYDGTHLYLHTAHEGKKMDIIKKNQAVCFEVSDSIKIITSDVACEFTTSFRSVIGYGKIYPLKDASDKKKALLSIMEQVSNQRDWSFEDSAFEKTEILQINIESVTGKSSGF